MKAHRLFVCATLALAASACAQSSPTLRATRLPLPPEPGLPPEALAAAKAGVKAMAENKFEAARTEFLKLLRLVPDSPTALTNLGLVDFRLGKADEAKGYLKHAVRDRPQNGLAWITLGLIYNNANEPEAATAALAQAVCVEPRNPGAHNYFAVILSRRGWYSGAEDELQRALQLDPNFAEAHFNLALTYLQQDPPAIELARRHYQKALDLGAARDAAIEQKLAKAPQSDQLP